ncbi:MAG: hypothetical protein HY907_23035 [Deltaproteobacteria bacterium]|nr:hypothetical protein [Deltaproteobacteria bacterium]
MGSIRAAGAEDVATQQVRMGELLETLGMPPEKVEGRLAGLSGARTPDAGDPAAGPGQLMDLW